MNDEKLAKGIIIGLAVVAIFFSFMWFKEVVENESLVETNVLLSKEILDIDKLIPKIINDSSNAGAIMLLRDISDIVNQTGEITLNTTSYGLMRLVFENESRTN